MLKQLLKVINSRRRYILLSISTIVIFCFLFKGIELNKIFAELSNANIVLLFYAFFLSIGFVILSGQKLKTLIGMMSYEIGFARSQKITIAAFSLNVIIPSKGGDFVKSWSLRDILPFSQGVGIVILERFIDLVLLSLMAIIGSIFINDFRLVIVSSSCLLMLFFGLMILKKLSKFNFKNKLFNYVKDFEYVSRSFFKNFRYSIFIVIIGICIWIGSALQAYVLYKALGQEIPIIYCVAVVPIVIFVGFIPITIGGMGTRDAAFIYLFSEYASSSASITVAMFFSLFRYWILALIGIPFLKYLLGNENLNSD
jgi:glycosyltransferase 2 family protein